MNYLAQPILQIVDNNGKPLVGGKLYVYDNDTQALADIYSDFEGHSLSNPVILDSLGHAKVLADEDKLYTIIVKNSNDELQFTIENATIVGNGGEITIEGKDFEIYAGNGINVTKTELIGGIIRYDISNNGIDNVDNGVCNFVLGKSNTNDGNYNLIYGRNNKVSNNSEDNIVGGTGNRIENDSNVYHSNISGVSNTITGSSVGNALITGDGNELKNVNLHSPIIAGCYNKVEGTVDDKPSDTTVILGKENKISGKYASSQLIGNYNEDTYGDSTLLGEHNKSSQYGNRILGYDNTCDGGNSHIIGDDNKTSNSSYDKIVGDHNKIDFTGKPSGGNRNVLVGYNLNVTDNTNTSDGKFVIGTSNEDNADAFMEIAKNGKNMIEIKHDDKIYFRYNDEMVQLKPSEADVKDYVDEKLAEKIVNETLDTSDEERAYTGKMIADYISDALSGNIGSWRGNLTVAQVNAIDDDDLKPGDAATITDSGTIRLGDFQVVAGDEIYYVETLGQWQKKAATYVRPNDYANTTRGGTIKSGSNDGEIQVNGTGVASLIGYNKHVTTEINPSMIGRDSPALDCKNYWYSMPDQCVRIVYNNRGTEYTLIFSKYGEFGTILRYSYTSTYLQILRKQGTSGDDNGWKSSNWETTDCDMANKVGHSLSLGDKTFNGSADVDVSLNDLSPTYGHYDFRINNQCVHMFTTRSIVSGNSDKFCTFAYTFRDNNNNARYGFCNLYWDPSASQMRINDFVYGNVENKNAYFYIRKNSDNTYNIYCKASDQYGYLSYAILTCDFKADIHNSVTTDTANLIPETVVGGTWNGQNLVLGTIPPTSQMDENTIYIG